MNIEEKAVEYLRRTLLGMVQYQCGGDFGDFYARTGVYVQGVIDDRRRLTVAELVQICAALGYTPDELLGFERSPATVSSQANPLAPQGTASAKTKPSSSKTRASAVRGRSERASKRLK